MGQIVSSAAKPKRCNANQLSQLGVLAAGLHVLVSSDNSMNAAGQGNFDCFIVGDGTKAATALELKPIADKEPTPNSKNAVTSGGVYANTPSNRDTSNDADLCIADESGNALLEIKGGHIKTKNFDSDKVTEIEVASADEDLCFSDENGYVVLKINNGNVFVKNFSSAPLDGKKISFLGDSITTYSGYPGSYNSFYTGSNAGITSVGQTWWKSFCNKQGAIVNRIYAYGGSDIVNGLCLHYNNLHSNDTSGTSPDVIFILGGINDWYHNNTLGTISDEEASNTTFYAAYKYLLKMLKETYPNSKIIGLTMLNSMINDTTIPYLNSNGDSIRDFCDAVIKCCNYYSVPSIDLNKMVNVNGNNYTSLLADYTHPNNVCAQMICNALNNNINTLNN